MTESRTADLIVIGAGVLGTFHAYFAATKGLKTLLLERNALPGAASTRNFGMLPQTIVEQEGPWASFARSSAEIYRSIQSEQDISVDEPGSLYLASTDAERDVLQEFMQLFGAEHGCVLMDGQQATRRYAFVQKSYCTAALLFPRDLSVEPRRMLSSLIPYIAQKGWVEYCPHTTVVSIEPSGRVYVARDSGGKKYVADHVVVCTGADYRTLFPDLFRESGLVICKVQMMRTAPQTVVRLQHSILSGLSIARYPGFAACPSYGLLRRQPVDQRLRDQGIHLLLKQAEDHTVVVGDSHEYGEWSDASTLEEKTDPEINESILQYGKSMVSLPNWTIKSLWNGYYLIHPREPIYTHTFDTGIHIVTGIGGKGMTTGPGFAKHSIDTMFPN